MFVRAPFVDFCALADKKNKLGNGRFSWKDSNPWPLDQKAYVQVHFSPPWRAKDATITIKGYHCCHKVNAKEFESHKLPPRPLIISWFSASGRRWRASSATSPGFTSGRRWLLRPSTELSVSCWLLNLSALSVPVSHWRDISRRHSSISIKIVIGIWRTPRSQHLFKIEDQRIISSRQFFSEEIQRNALYKIKHFFGVLASSTLYKIKCSTQELQFFWVKSGKIKFFRLKNYYWVPDLKNIRPSGSKRLLDPIFVEIVDPSGYLAHDWSQFIKILLRPGEKLASSGFSFFISLKSSVIDYSATKL